MSEYQKYSDKMILSWSKLIVAVSFARSLVLEILECCTVKPFSTLKSNQSYYYIFQGVTGLKFKNCDPHLALKIVFILANSVETGEIPHSIWVFSVCQSPSLQICKKVL